MNRNALIITLAIFAISTVVYGHGGATGIIKERMDLMDNLKGVMKELKPIMRGQKEYDVETVKRNALLIQDHSGEHMTRLFPDGSLKMPSEATAEIWTEWGNFQRIAGNLERLAQALYDGAANEQNLESGKGMGNTMMGNSNHMSGRNMMGESGPMIGSMIGSMNGHMNGHMNGRMGGQMGGQGMMGAQGQTAIGMQRGLDNMSDEHLASMPSASLFRMIGQSCASCHKKYRIEK
jgi:cytochrome c556